MQNTTVLIYNNKSALSTISENLRGEKFGGFRKDMESTSKHTHTHTHTGLKCQQAKLERSNSFSVK